MNRVFGMDYIFFDERYSNTSNKHALIVSAWAVSQEVFNDHLNLVPRRKPLLAQINSFFTATNALGFVARAEFGKSFMRPGEVDSCDDVQAMARTDNAWSMAMVFVLGHLLRHLWLIGRPIAVADLYFDNKDLTESHRLAWEKTIRELLSRGVESLVSTRGFGNAMKPTFRRIEFVCKPKRGEQPKALQLGVRISDRLCARSAEVFNGEELSHIKRRDMSEVIIRTIGQWDGVPYDA